MFIQIDKGMYEKLSEAKEEVIQFLNQNEEEVPYMSITNVTEKTFTSQSMVSRTIQKCGYQGIPRLRHAISQQEQMKEHHGSNYGMDSILAKSYRESTKAIDSISPAVILKTIEYIKQAKHMFIFARGFTALIAEKFQMYLQPLGCNAIIVKDVKWMENTEHIVIEDDIAFTLSLRDSTPGLVRGVRAARMKGVKVITCCCKSPCELEKSSDITTYGHPKQIMEVSGMTVYSGIPLLIIMRATIEYIGQQSS